MPFRLSRGGNNVIAEVQRWQYFLLKQNIPQIGKVDGDFGSKTEESTKIFQLKQNLAINGKLDAATLGVAEALGYTVLSDDYYQERGGPQWPPKPANLSSPAKSWRNENFGCFRFLQRDISHRDRPERIVIRGSCDGLIADWSNANIVELHDSTFSHVEGYNGYFRVHEKARDQLVEVIGRWKSADLLHLVISFAGAFDPRYIKGASPGDGPHPERNSAINGGKLSNHAFGSAFDINTTWNWIGEVPAFSGQKGSVRELVEIANATGFYWGGHFGGDRIDGMHFEIAR